ncbi:MAG: type III polyketide synthase, partial [Planctomycetota bacterium]
ALERAGVSLSRVTDLVVVTCTGFAAPGLHSDLVESLGLPSSIRPLQIGFMGCFGGIAALRAARNAAAADADAVVLVVAVELCSLHFRRSCAPDALVSFALFADGASAAVVAGEDAGLAPVALLEDPRTKLLGGRRLMGWTVEDDGFAMTLGKAVPDEIARHVAEAADGVGGAVAVHPGGLAIIEAVERGLGRRGSGDFADAREVLRTTGNTSSGAVLRVAERVLSRNQRPVGCEAALQPVGAPGPSVPRAAGSRVDLMAFGPGLVADRIAAIGAD